jgi:integrase
MKPKLTNISIAKKKPKAERYEVQDGGCRNLVLVIQPSGVKSWALRFRFRGDAIRFTLGRYLPEEKASKNPQIGDDLSIADAHKLATDILHKARLGIDPRKEKRDRKDEAQLAAQSTLRAVAEKYLTDVCGMRTGDDGTVSFDRDMMRSGAQQYRTLRSQILPTLGDRPIEAISKSDIREWLDKLAKGKLRNDRDELIEGGKISANRALAVVRAILLHLEKQSDSYRAPSFLGLSNPEKARERDLEEWELKVIWRVASAADTPFNLFVKFLILTASRRNEPAQMMRGEVTIETVKWNGKTQAQTIWTIPASRSKSKREDVKPLSQMAIDVLDRLPKFVDSQFYFTTDGEHPISTFSRWKRQFDEQVLAELRKTDPKAKPLERWTLHDLRRTSRGLLSKAGILPDIGERCLGHVIGGIRGTYDKYSFLKEKTEAFAALANLIQSIVAPPDGSKVVQLRV